MGGAVSGSFAFDLRPDGTAVVRAFGELDVLTAPAFLEALQSAVDSARATVVIDLTDVSFADLTGLLPLLDTESQLRAEGRRVVRRGAQPSVARIIDLAINLVR